MKYSKLAALVFAILLLCLLTFFFPLVSEQTVAKFRQQEVAAPLLDFGETGKILKMLGAIYPVENKDKKEIYSQNVIEVIERAVQERKKLVQVPPYDRYADEGIFCYFELSSEEDNIPLTVSSRSGKEWQVEKFIHLRNNRQVQPFFLDLDGPKFTLDFHLRNTLHPVEIRSIVFLQSGYRPIVFSDPIAYRKFLQRSNSAKYSVGPASFTVLPDDDRGKHHKITLSFKEKWMTNVSSIQKKQGATSVQLTTRENQPLLKALSFTEQELIDLSRANLPIVAIDIAAEDLYSDQFGILKNYDGHGRQWERLAYVRFFRDGQEAFATFTGLRLQGGDPGRAKGLVNFRVFFREEYGRAHVASKLVFPGTSGDLKRFVIKQAEWPDWPMLSPMAYDIARRAGALAPVTEAVELYLNGASLGLYYLAPHLGERQLRELLPDGDYLYYRWRGRVHIADQHFWITDFWQKLRENPLTKKYAAAHFDLDNLQAHLLSIIFSGTGDYCQGLVLKKHAPGSKVFWYNWDMDHSFVDVEADIFGHPRLQQRWQKAPSFRGLYKSQEGGRRPHCPRVHLFNRLVNEDRQFRQESLENFLSILNHHLTDGYLYQLLWEYFSILETIDYPNRETFIAIVSEFFRHRREFLVGEIEAIAERPVILCQVTANRYPIKVDGVSQSAQYQGYHFAGSALEISAGQDGPATTGFTVNGQHLSGGPYRFAIEAASACRFDIILP
jgi:hypothetical protein